MPAKARAAVPADTALKDQAMARIAENARAEARDTRAAARRSPASSGTRTTRPQTAPRARRTSSPSSPAPAAAAAPVDNESGSESEAAPSSPSTPAPARSFGVEGAGAVLALFAYPLLVNLLQGGPAQMWGWVRAKWLNQPYGGVGNAGPTSQTGRQTVFLPPAVKQANGTVTRQGQKAT